MLDLLKSLGEKLLNKSRVTVDDSTANSRQTRATAIGQKLYDDMLAYFRDVITGHSVGKKMIFHMGYIVWFEQSDYTRLKDELVAIVPEVIDGFYDEIKAMKTKYPKCVPPSLSWSVQATPATFMVDHDTDGNMTELTELKPGEFVISSTFFSNGNLWTNVQQQPNVVLSYRPQNSNTMKEFDVNKNIFLGIDSVGGVISEKFDFTKAGLSEEVRAEVKARNSGYATLKYSTSEGHKICPITDKSFYVSGLDDERNQPNVLKLPDKSIAKGHLIFRYNEADDSFEVAAFGHTVLNERLLEPSTPGNPHWNRVSKKASFIIGDNFGLEFIQPV